MKKQDFLLKSGCRWQEIAEKNIALHSTDLLTPPLSLWARCSDFDPADYFRELNNAGSLIRMRAFRGTLFAVHKKWVGHVLAALPVFMGQRIREAERFLQRAGVDPEQAGEEICSRIAGEFMQTRELKKQLPDSLSGELLPYLIRYLEISGRITRTTQKHLTDPVVRYGLWRDWLPDLQPVDPETAIRELALAYIHQFGPVTLDDLCWWFPLTKTKAREVLEGLVPTLCPINIDGREYFMTEKDFSDMQSVEMRSPNDGIAFLPYEDHFVKAFTDRNWFLGRDVLPLVTETGIQMQGQVLPSIWQGGQIIGRWRIRWEDKQKSSAQVEVVELLDNTFAGEAIERHRQKLEIFINEQIAPLVGTGKKP